MLPIVLKALSLAKYVPAIAEVVNSVKEGNKAEVAEKIIQTANKVASEVIPGFDKTEIGEVDLSIAAEKNAAFRQQLIMEVESKKQEWLKLYLDDVKDARKYGEQNKDTMNKLTDRVMNFSLLVVVLMVLIQVGCIYFFKDNGMVIALVGNVVCLVIGQLLGERLQILNYYFGSSVIPHKPDEKK